MTANTQESGTKLGDGEGLPALQRRLRFDLDCLGFPGKAWAPERRHDTTPVCDVVIIGGGMCGMVAWLALQMVGVRNIRILDRAPKGFEGPWLTYARMETLRSPKHLTGPAFGIGALSFQAWYRAQFGQLAWTELDKIPRMMWMDYLRWYRDALGVPVENQMELVGVSPLDDLLQLTVRGRSEETILTRKLVYATGREGSGHANVPGFAANLPNQYWAHSEDDIDFPRLKGKRVAVVGAGASAVENAAEALEAGAAEVRLLVRRKQLPAVNKMMGIGSGGFVNGFAELPDEWRWRIMHYGATSQTPPPRGSMLRVKRYANGYFHFGKSISSVSVNDEALMIEFEGGEHLEFDFMILGTGFGIDTIVHTELGEAAGNILTWEDAYNPPSSEQNPELSRFPYLGSGFEFLEKEPGQTPWLRHIRCFNYAATLSLGKVSGDIPGVSDGAAWLARALSSQLYSEDIAEHWANLQAYDKPELLGDEWIASELPAGFNKGDES